MHAKTRAEVIHARDMLVLSINLLYIIHTALRESRVGRIIHTRCNYTFVISRIISQLAAGD